MNVDFRVACNFFSNLKVRKLKRRFGLQGVYSLLRLWGMTATNYPSGEYKNPDFDLIAEVVEYPENIREFFDFLLEENFIEKTKTGFKIHEWEIHNGYASTAEKRSESARKANAVRWGKESDSRSDSESDRTPPRDPPYPYPNPSPKPNPNPPSPKIKFSPEHLEMAQFIFSKILELNPNHKKPNLEKWAEEIRLMVDRDNRSLEEIRSLFTWANNDAFWQKNILSPAKLREKWDALKIKSATRLPQNHDLKGKDYGKIVGPKDFIDSLSEEVDIDPDL